MSDEINNTNTSSLNNIIQNTVSTMKVVKTLEFEAFMEGTERDQYRPWTINSMIDKPRIERKLLPPLIRYMVEFSKVLGELVPNGAEEKDPNIPKGIDVLDGVDGIAYPEAMLMSVRVVLNFVKIKDNLAPEDLAYAIKEIGRKIKADEHLVALATTTDEELNTIPTPEVAMFRGDPESDIWFLYVRTGENRPYYKSREENGQVIWEDTGKMFFPEKSAWKFLDDKKRIVGNPMMLNYTRGYHERAKEKAEKYQQQKQGYSKRDDLGSIGDNVKFKENRK